MIPKNFLVETGLGLNDLIKGCAQCSIQIVLLLRVRTFRKKSTILIQLGANKIIFSGI